MLPRMLCAAWDKEYASLDALCCMGQGICFLGCFVLHGTRNMLPRMLCAAWDKEYAS